MEIKTSGQSSLRLNKLYVKEITFNRKENIGELKVNLKIAKEVISRTKNDIKIALKAELLDENENIYINIILEGDFNISDLDIKECHDIIENNTIAIMFPYLRSQVTLLTSQPDLTPIILPVMNINELLKK